MAPALQSAGMLSREQLLRLFDDFSLAVSRPEVKKRIADAVRQKQEAVAVTTEIQEELLEQMGIEPKFGISCLGKVNAVYKDDKQLMLQFYAFVTKEELACDEAELGAQAFNQKMQQFEKVQNQQLELLQQLRTLPIKDQQAFLEQLRDRMQQEPGSSVLDFPGIQEFMQRQQ